MNGRTARALARQRPLARGASVTPPAGVGLSGRRRCVAGPARPWACSCGAGAALRPTGGQRAMEGARRLGPGLAGTNSGPPGPIRVKSRPWPGLVGSGWREEAFQDGMGLGSRLLPLRPLLMEIPRSPIRRRFKTGGSRASARQRPLARGASLTPPAGVGPSGRRRCVAAQGVCPTRRRGGVATDRRAAGEVLTMGTGRGATAQPRIGRDESRPARPDPGQEPATARPRWLGLAGGRGGRRDGRWGATSCHCGPC